MNLFITGDDLGGKTRAVLGLNSLGCLGTEQDCNHNQRGEDIRSTIDHHPQLEQSMCHLQILHNLAYFTWKDPETSFPLSVIIYYKTAYDIRLGVMWLVGTGKIENRMQPCNDLHILRCIVLQYGIDS